MSQVDTSEKLSEAEEPSISLLTVCGFGIAAIAMIGWICALGWLVWRLGEWLLS